MSSIIEKLRKRIPLRTRLKVLNEMLIQSYLIDIGFIPDGYWSDEKEEKYGKSFRALAEKMTDSILEEITEWEKDGKPTDENNMKSPTIMTITPDDCKFFDESQGKNYCTCGSVETKRCVGIKCGNFEEKLLR